MVISLLAKGMGYAEKLILAYYYGTSVETDVYLVVLGIVMSTFLLVRELVEPGYLPVFQAALKGDDPQKAWRLFNDVARLILLGTVLLVVAGVFNPGPVVRLFAPGFEAPAQALAERLFQLSYPAAIFWSLSALTYITLNGLKRFFLPALGDIAMKLGAILTIALAQPYWGVNAMGVAILIGAMARLGVHLFALSSKINVARTSFRSPEMRQMGLLTLPILAGVLFSQASTLIDNSFASLFTEGAVAALSYAKKVVELPILVLPYALSIVIFPYFSSLHAAQKHGQQQRLLGETLYWIFLFFLPLAILFGLFAGPLVQLVFERGAFDASSTALTRAPLLVYAFGMPALAVETILVLYYFSVKDTRTPILVGISMVILNILLAWLTMDWLGYVAIAGALVVSKSLKNLILLLLLRRKFAFAFSPIIVLVLKVFLGAGLAGLVAWVSLRTWGEGSGDMGTLFRAGWIVGTGVATYGVYVLLLLVMGVQVQFWRMPAGLKGEVED